MKEKISVQSFIEEFISRKIKNDRITPNAVEDYIREKLDIIEYLPFNTKREIVEMVVDNNITEEDGVKKVDDISQYLGFICAMLLSHTNLVMSANPADDYDLLSQCGLLGPIIEMFKTDYEECDVLRKMKVTNALQDNNFNVLVGKFLNGILGKLDGVGDVLQGFAEKIDVSKLLGEDIKKEDIAKLIGFVDKLK